MIRRYTGFINIYRSGAWHKPGKPGAFDRHGGDVYATLGEAYDAVDPVSHYVATVAVEWDDDSTLKVNPGRV